MSVSIDSKSIIGNIFNRSLIRTKSLSAILNFFYKKSSFGENQLLLKKLAHNLQTLFSKTVADIKKISSNDTLIIGTTKLVGLLSRQGFLSEKLTINEDNHENIYEFLVQLKDLVIDQLNAAPSTPINKRAIYNHIEEISNSSTNEGDLHTIHASIEHIQKLHDEIISNGNVQKHNLRVASRLKTKEISAKADKRFEEIISEYSDLNHSANDEKLIKTEEYLASLEKTMSVEKMLRNEIFEKKAILRDLISQYDTNMAERWLAKMNIQQQYEYDQDQFDNWMKTFHAQEIVFNDVLIKIQAKEFQQRIQLLIQNRCARIIQRNFLEFCARKKTKSKKGKPKLKGKK